MRKNLFAAATLTMMIVMFGCAAHDETLRLAVHSALREDTDAVSKLAREQAQLIASNASPSDVYGKVLQADPVMKKIREACTDPAKGGKELASSCVFYKELSSKFRAAMMLSAGKYYLKKDDRKESEKILRELVDTYSENAYQAETRQARTLLDAMAQWDSLTSGMKAYIIGDYGEALRLLKIREDAESLYYVGQIYYFGSGVPRDSKEASDWYRKSADKGFAPAEYRVGLLYYYGEGVEEDASEAKKWLKKAYEQEYAPAREALRVFKIK
jgi:TPR repeat protein